MIDRTIHMIAGVALASQLHAQSVGEIRGKVVDDRGEPLYGASVVVERAAGPLISTCDLDGKFILKPLQPGTYTLRITMVTFRPAEMRGINVQSEKITFLDEVRLEAANELPGIDVFYWKRKLIDPEEPSRKSLLAEEFKNDPNRRDPVRMIAKSFAGVSASPRDEGLHFRGSRTSDMAYFVDGVKVTGRLTGVTAAGMQSIAVYTGGLPARYGDVTGGVVVIETKSYMDMYEERSAASEATGR